MSKIGICGDIHGRQFWKIIKEHKDEFEKIVFLGDYVSPYSYEGITNEGAISVFEEVLEFKKENPKNVHTMKNEKEIQQLIERFLYGETCNAEEQVLYDYFNGKDVADNLISYREMFRWYAAGMPEQKTNPPKRTYVRWLAIAASLLLLVGIGFSVWQYQKQQEQYAIYEGSYIIRNGIKNTDIKEILPELKATELQVSEMLEQQNTNQEIPTI